MLQTVFQWAKLLIDALCYDCRQLWQLAGTNSALLVAAISGCRRASVASLAGGRKGGAGVRLHGSDIRDTRRTLTYP